MYKKLTTSILVFSTLVVFGASPVLAQSATPNAHQAKTQAREATLQTKAATDITARVDALNKAVGVLNTIKKISDTDKSALVAQVQSEIQTMQALATKIQGDTDIATLKTDVQSITKAYRVYRLFIPKVHILAASDRINDTIALMQDVVSKLQARITSGGATTSSLQTTLDDASAKILDAKTQAQNANSLVIGLQPDNGDQTVLQSNTTVLNSAKNDIKTANTDLKAARQDFQTIIQALKTNKKSPAPSVSP